MTSTEKFKHRLAITLGVDISWIDEMSTDSYDRWLKYDQEVITLDHIWGHAMVAQTLVNLKGGQTKIQDFYPSEQVDVERDANLEVLKGMDKMAALTAVHNARLKQMGEI